MKDKIEELKQQFLTNEITDEINDEFDKYMNNIINEIENMKLCENKYSVKFDKRF